MYYGSVVERFLGNMEVSLVFFWIVLGSRPSGDLHDWIHAFIFQAPACEELKFSEFWWGRADGRCQHS